MQVAPIMMKLKRYVTAAGRWRQACTAALTSGSPTNAVCLTKPWWWAVQSINATRKQLPQCTYAR